MLKIFAFIHDILSVLILELFLNLGQLRREKENLLKLNTTNLNFLRNRVIQFHVQSGKTYEIKIHLQQQKGLSVITTAII